MAEKWHGTTGGYTNHKCRCDNCRQAWNASCVSRRAAARQYISKNPESIPEHGYRGYRAGCRCVECRNGHNAYNRSKKIARLAASPRSEECQLCGNVPARGTVMDHDHRTGAFRGWLCHSCNTGLGKLGDNREGIVRAISYLKRC